MRLLHDGELLGLGTDGKSRIYPFRVTFQENLTDFLQILTRVSTRQPASLAWVGLLVAGGRGDGPRARAAGYGLAQPVAVAVLVVVAIAAEHESIGLSPAVEVSVASLVYVFAAVVFGPLAGVIVGALASWPICRDAMSLNRSSVGSTWTSIRVIVVGAAGLAAVVVTHATRRRFLGTLRAQLPRRSSSSRVADIALAARRARDSGTGSCSRR